MNQPSVKHIKEKVEPLLRHHHVEFAAVFGSAARGRMTPESDIDILVRYAKTPGLFAHIGLAQQLEEMLQAKVDLVTERSLKKALVPFVKKDLRVLYGRVERPDLH